MSSVNRWPLWTWKRGLTPGGAVLFGVAIGGAIATVAAFTPPRDFTLGFLSILLLGIVPFTGIFGYILWLSRDPVREHRLRRLTGLVAFPTVLGLLIAFPDFWWKAGPQMGVMLMGFVCAMALFVVAAGMATAHLVGHVAYSFRRSTKPGVNLRTDGVWDRELD
jgi:pimeloyl-ACP methyl ester carboxylesterase